MSKVRELRTKADHMLDNLEAQAVALESKISETNEEFSSRFQGMKSEISTNIEPIKTKVKEVQGLADEQKEKIAGSFEHLQLQLALGRVATKDTLRVQKELIGNAAAAARAHIVANADQMDADLDKQIDAWIDALEKLEAEMEAADLAWDAEWRTEMTAATAEWKAKKQGLKAEIASFQSELQKRKDMTGDKLEAFNKEMTGAFSKIGSAFRNLAS